MYVKHLFEVKLKLKIDKLSKRWTKVFYKSNLHWININKKSLNPKLQKKSTTPKLVFF